MIKEETKTRVVSDILLLFLLLLFLLLLLSS
jgi:hypothetical protein